METEKKNVILREGFLVKRVRHLRFITETLSQVGVKCLICKPDFCLLFGAKNFMLKITVGEKTGRLKKNWFSIWFQGHLVHNWKARWFVLMPDKLLYYKYEGGRKDSCQRGKIMLKDCVITSPFLEYENRPVSSSLLWLQFGVWLQNFINIKGVQGWVRSCSS